MAFSAGLSTVEEKRPALEEVCRRALDELQGTPDLAFLFFSPHHAEEVESLAVLAQQQLAAHCLVGCSGEAIVGNDQEIEKNPALSLWLGRWHQPVELEAFHLMLEQ